MNRTRIRAIVRKDISEVLANKMVVMPLIVVPAVLCIIMPVAVTILGLTLDVNIIQGAELLERVIPLYPVPEVFSEKMSQILYVFLNYTFLPLFMLVPIMVSSVISANSVVGEKERKTLETLLYTPVTNREFVTAKLLSAFLPAILVSLASFVVFFAAANLAAYSHVNTLIVRSPIWIPGMLLLSPAVSLLGLSITLLVSMKAKTYMEAQQTAGIIVLPFVALVAIQISGLLVFNAWYVAGFGLALLLIDYIVISRLGPRFNREAIVATL